MSQRILLQTLLKFRDRIKDGSAKVQDIITDYFNQTGKSVTDDERTIILDEFAKEAPDNVTTLEGVDPRETILPMGLKEEMDKADELMDFFKKEIDKQTKKGPNVQKAGEMSDTPFSDTLKKQNPDVEIRGDEGFGELIEKLGRGNKINEEGIGSLFFKDKDGFDDRAEAAEFIRKMRGAGIKNEDIRKIFKENPPYRKKLNFLSGRDETILDLEPGKRAATTLARAADMKADTKIKQEALADLDDDIANYGPNWWRGEGMADGPMGFDSRQQATSNIITKINNGIVDDLERAGVDEEKVSFIFRNLSDTRDRLKNDPKAFVQKVADELEFEEIDYDLTFWNKYVDEIMSRMQKPEPRFMFGGVV